MTARHVRTASLVLVVTGVLGCYEPFFKVQRERVTRATHTPIFPVLEGAHGGADCDACHGDFETFTRFTCISCHEHDQASTDPHHAGVVGYEYDATGCYGCHPSGIALGRADHEVLFPIVTGAHGGMACENCHVTDYRGFSCIDCHDHAASIVDPAHNGVSGYQYASDACYRCHPRGEAMSRAAHDPLFPIASGRHRDVACTDCHVNGYDSFSCIDCHVHLCSITNGHHQEVANYRCESPLCLQCHPRGVAGD
ncbi:MAG: cytochrome c3 family protein [Pseudomonadota bacterium]